MGKLMRPLCVNHPSLVPPGNKIGDLPSIGMDSAMCRPLGLPNGPAGDWTTRAGARHAMLFMDSDSSQDSPAKLLAKPFYGPISPTHNPSALIMFHWVGWGNEFVGAPCPVLASTPTNGQNGRNITFILWHKCFGAMLVRSWAASSTFSGGWATSCGGLGPQSQCASFLGGSILPTRSDGYGTAALLGTQLEALAREQVYDGGTAHLRGVVWDRDRPALPRDELLP